MLETMYAAPGRGLAAPQVGRAIRLFVMDATWKEGTPEPAICVNPEIVEHPEERVTGTEVCLSIPGVSAEVARSPWIVLRWITPGGQRREARLEGAVAICAQHECDHLDGIVTFDRIAPEQRAALEATYAG
jgi:peptide deformylase